MVQFSKQHFDHLFIIYYITYDYKFIIIIKYIWLQIQSYKIYIIKIKNLHYICLDDQQAAHRKTKRQIEAYKGEDKKNQ